MSIDPRKYIEVDKRFPDSMAGDANRVLTVKADESGYEHNPNVVMEKLVGTIIMWPLDTPPQGYLICDGAEYDIATHPALGALLGENAPGSGKFNVPDISFAKNSRGVDTGQTEQAVVGEHDHDIDPAPAHAHSVTIDAVSAHQHAVSGGGHNHDLTVFQVDPLDAGQCIPRNRCTGDSGTYSVYGGDHTHDVGKDGDHTHTAVIGDDGSHNHKLRPHGVGQESQPACTLVNFCIRT